MKFQCIDEMSQISLDGAVIRQLTKEEGVIEFTFDGATIKDRNSQNGRFQDMYCGEMVLKLFDSTIVRIVKEGYKYYDADGNLKEEVPNREVPAPEQDHVWKRLHEGTVFTTVEASVAEGYGYEIGIDVPKEEDEEEVDTFWLCVTFGRSEAGWNRYLGPVES